MGTLHRFPRATVLFSSTVAVATVFFIARADGLRAVWDALTRMHPIWLAVALGLELVAYLGYIAAYRNAARPPGRSALPLKLTIHLVVAGFGPLAPLGGFSFDRHVLGRVHENERTARVQVMGLGVIEYALLAPAAWTCALVLLIENRASPALTLPWVLAVPPGVALAAIITIWRAPHTWLNTGRGRIRERLGEALAALSVVRRLVQRPLDYPLVPVGMALYWAAEIACLGAALRCFGIVPSIPALVLAHATGYVASRRSLPFGGAGVTEALLTLALIWVHVPAPSALLAVGAYRLVNLIAPTLPALAAHASLTRLMDKTTPHPRSQ